MVRLRAGLGLGLGLNVDIQNETIMTINEDPSPVDILMWTLQKIHLPSQF